MKKHSLKSLLVEGIINQSEFVEKLLAAIVKNPNIVSSESLVYRTIIKNFRRAKRLNIGNSNPKAARKAAEIAVQKALREIPSKEKTRGGLDSYSGIEIKPLLPLYDSIIDYLNTDGNISLDDCIYAADFYMKKLYKGASEEEKKIIQSGRFDFSLIFERTNYYFKYGEEVVDSSKFVDIYEDDNYKIVYPSSPAAFRYYLKSLSSERGFGTFTYCTLINRNWYTHNRSEIVAIVLNKNLGDNDEDSVISLKIRYEDGSINYDKTADRFNINMGMYRVRDAIPDDVLIKAGEFTQQNKDLFFMSPDIPDEEVENITNVFLDVDKPNELANIMMRNFENNNVKTFCTKLVNKVDIETFANILVTALANIEMIIFEGYFQTNDEEKAGVKKLYESIDVVLRQNNIDINDFYKLMSDIAFKKGIVSNSNPAYFVFALKNIQKGTISFDSIGKEKFLRMVDIAFKTNNEFTLCEMSKLIYRVIESLRLEIEDEITYRLLNSKTFPNTFDSANGNIKDVLNKFSSDQLASFLSVYRENDIVINSKSEEYDCDKFIKKIVVGKVCSERHIFEDRLGINNTADSDIIFYLENNYFDDQNTTHEYLLANIAYSAYTHSSAKEKERYYFEKILRQASSSTLKKFTLADALSILKTIYISISNANVEVVSKLINLTDASLFKDIIANNITNASATNQLLFIKNKDIEKFRKEYIQNLIQALRLTNLNIFEVTGNILDFIKDKSFLLEIEKIPFLKKQYEDCLASNHDDDRIFSPVYFISVLNNNENIRQILENLGENLTKSLIDKSHGEIKLESMNSLCTAIIELNFESCKKSILKFYKNVSILNLNEDAILIFEENANDIRTITNSNTMLFMQACIVASRYFFPYRIILNILKTGTAAEETQKKLINELLKKISETYAEDYEEFKQENSALFSKFNITKSERMASLRKRMGI